MFISKQDMKKGTDFTGITIVYYCHDGEGRFLMNKRSINCRDEHGCWDIGGGGLEFGHTPEYTLKKEIREEYCTEVLDYEFLGFRDIHRSIGVSKDHWISLDYKVLVDKHKVENGEPHKFDDIGWFDLTNLPDPLHSQLPDFINKYKDRLILGISD